MKRIEWTQSFGTVLFFLSILGCDGFSGFIGLDGEAFRLGKKYFDGRLLKCGDSWFGRHAKGFVQMKGVKLVVVEEFLNEAEKANGWEWRGSVWLQGSMFRKYDDGRGWEQWSLWTGDWIINFPGDFERRVYLTRISGRWQVVPMSSDPGGAASGLFILIRFRKVDFTCGAIPK